jgi:hypothetical protein
MFGRLVIGTALAFGALAAPAAGAQIDELKPCYVSAGRVEERRESIDVHGTGFSPDAVIDIYVDGVLVLSDGRTNAVGEVMGQVKAPYQSRGEREFTLTVAERDNPENVVTVTSRVTTLRVTLTPREARPSRRVRFRGRGFTQPAPVYAHYLYAGKEQKTVRLARRSTAPCGTFDVRRRQIPVEDPRTGRWIMQVDQKRAYAPEPDPVWVRLPIKVVVDFLEP